MVTILAVLFCCYTVRYYITNLLCLDFEYLGGPTFGWDGPIRGFLKIRPPPSLSSHLSSSPMGVFSKPTVLVCACKMEPIVLQVVTYNKSTPNLTSGLFAHISIVHTVQIY